MILADTSIWIDHFRVRNQHMLDLIGNGQLLIHEFIIAEIALGSVPNRTRLIDMLLALPDCGRIPPPDMLQFIDRHELTGRGIGLVDANLLASAAEIDKAKLWTNDKRLSVQAERLDLEYKP